MKAAYLFHFAQLVDWPAGVLGDDKTQFSLCTLGDDPFHGDLESVVEGKAIGPRTIHVRHLKHVEDVRSCQMVFISRDEGKRTPALLDELASSPIVTVGETDSFVQEGGMIRLFLEDDKVRFEINLGAAERARLKISSRLLLLAKTVER